MACLIRKTDTAVFVPKGDPCAVLPGRESPDPDWLLEQGQPADCTRVRVRALTAEESLALSDGKDGGVIEAGRIGFVELFGGEEKFDELPGVWQAAIGLLVLAVTGNPLIGARFRWMGSASPETSASEG